ncbi:hypothetical protein E4T49_05273 [Aureobasidium sp. EXF-10728]|nr:hypothetical protein E4T49_05273 [Aureobasidium sp. EXF-10728]
MASNHGEASSMKQAANTEDLIALAKSALAETEEKQLAALDGGAQLPFGYGTQPGDTLDLSDKGVRVLPVELINLIKDRVERLSLGHNRLTEIPADLIFCSNLLYLNLRHNKLNAFPEPVFHLRKLQILDLSHNNITSVPDDVGLMYSLMFLAIESNQIKRLPICMGEMSRLQKLKVGSKSMEFPPPEVFIPNPLSTSPGGPLVEEARQVCSQVKLFLREYKQREILGRETPDFSETSLETPRPPKRSISGRFPVRPSMSGIDGLETLRSGDGLGLKPPPPIPQKSRARDSLINPPVGRRFDRPGIGPLAADGETGRSRSETVTSTGARSKRLGYVPRKISGSSHTTVTETGTLKAYHHRGASSLSLAAHSGNESSSGAVSPMEPSSRMIVARRRLSSLPEDRRVSRPTSMTVKLATRIVFALFQLNGPIGDAVRVIKSGTPRKTTMERIFFESSASLEELDRRLSQISNGTGESRASENDPWIQAIRRKCAHVLQSYATLAAELRLHARKIALRGEGMYIRSLMLHIYGTLIEIRNALTFQATEVKAPTRSARGSTATISRSSTPTQPKPIAPKKRLRGATILQPSRLTTPGTAPPPVPLSTSRSNTMTSMSAVTPRSGESFSSASGIPRSSAIQPPSEESEEQRQFESIFLKLQGACELAAQTLPGCRVDFYSRNESAKRSMQGSISRLWWLALQKCDVAINALESMRNRLSKVKLKDPNLRTQRDFWLLCDKFVRTWLDLALEIRNIGNQGYDTDSVKVVMRPVQKAVKEVSIAVNGSQLYQAALRSNSVSGYVTPVPATPLSAALGPAALATVPSTPSSVVLPSEYIASGLQSAAERQSDAPSLRSYPRGRGV